jgi:NAD(P)H dehydrogenase (quinone)
MTVRPENACKLDRRWLRGPGLETDPSQLLVSDMTRSRRLGRIRRMPVNVTIVLAHPAPRSFNHALAGAVFDRLSLLGHNVALHDLHAEGFDPILPASEIPEGAALPPAIEAHCREIAAAHGIVIVHPNWWGQPPAILKGWIDRVMRPGVAYRFLEGDEGEGVPEGLLKARTALVLNTSNTPDERERRVFGDPLQRTWADCVFGLCGVAEVRRRVFSVVITSTPEQRAAWLEEAGDLAGEGFPAPEC